MLSEFVAALQRINPEITDEDIADVIWLARYTTRSQAGTSSDSNLFSPETGDSSSLADTVDSSLELPNTQKSHQESTPQSTTGNVHLDADVGNSGGGQQIGALPFRSPAVVALPEALNLARALRPFKRKVPLLTEFVLNEEATAQRSAEEGRWVPVLDYAKARWLDVALVIDKGSSMAIWQQTVAEFHLLLMRQGAFRDVRLWELDTKDKEKVHLYAGSGAGKHKGQPRSELELIDASKRRLIFVVTDCISPAWHSGKAAETLEKWGRYNSITLVQVLPQLLWSRTALKRATPLHIHVTSPGIPNIRFERREEIYWYAEEAQASVPIPIVTLEPKPLANWARVIARAEDRWIPGFELATSPAEERKAASSLSAAERVQRFRANASPLAYRLAALLTAVPISLPIIRLIQRTLLPESDQTHLAEVFLGGLLKVVSANSDTLDPDYVQYDFVDGVRERLVPSVSTSDTSRVLAKMTDFLEENFGKALDFRALLANPLATEGVVISKESRPFAQVAAKLLRPLGGDYVSLANWLEKKVDEVPVEEQPTGPIGIEKKASLHGEGGQVRGEGVVSTKQVVEDDNVVHDSTELGTQEIIDSGKMVEGVTEIVEAGEAEKVVEDDTIVGHIREGGFDERIDEKNLVEEDESVASSRVVTTNPFNFGSPVSSNKMVGRWDQVEAIARDLMNFGGHSHVVVGGRRFGKSTFLEALQYFLIRQIDQTKSEEWYFIPVLINLKRLIIGDEEAVFGLFLNSLYYYFNPSHDKRELDIHFDFGLEKTRLYSYVQNRRKECSLDEFTEIIDDFLTAFDNSLRNLRLIFLIDEIEVTLGRDWTETFFNQLRSLVYDSSLREYIRFVIAGSSQIMNRRENGSPLLNMLKVTFLEALEEKDILNIIHLAGDVPKDVTGAVLRQCGGHPFIAQYLMYHLWEIDISKTTIQSVIKVANKFTHERFADLEQWLRDIGKEGQLVYKFLATSNNWLTEARLKKLVNTPDLQVMFGLIALCYHGLAIQDGTWSEYRFSGELFKGWFQNNVLPTLEISGLPASTSKSPVTSTGIPSILKSSLTPTTVITIFIAYSYKDNKIQQEVMRLLNVLQHQALNIKLVSSEISLTNEWKSKDPLLSADIILLLVSWDFVGSEFCYSEQLEKAIAKHNRRETRVIPIIIKACPWDGTPFAKLPSLPKNGRSVDKWKSRDKALVDIAEGIRAAVDERHLGI